MLDESSRLRQTFDDAHENLLEKSISLLESRNDNNKLVYQLMQGQKQQNYNSSANGDLFHESSKEIENREYNTSDISDPRFSYANPYSSYANAMLSPLMEMQTLSSKIHSESRMEEEDEFNETIEAMKYVKDHQNRMNKNEEISHEKGKFGKLNLMHDEIIQELKPNDATIIVHPEIHIPAAIISDTNKEQKKEINEMNENLPMSKINPQIKLGKVEARVFLRDAKPKMYHSEAQQRPQISSDTESRMIVTDEDSRLYYTDSECITSHNKHHFQRHKKPIHYAIPYYARVPNTQETTQTDTLVQQFLMRVNISEDRSCVIPDRLQPHQPSFSSSSSTSPTFKHPINERKSTMNEIQHTVNQQQLSPDETNRINCKHTLV
ncbi:hypothetical protein LOAG_11875 [Loa loa]|uniref:Uncharacterized protein n=1 Tax=Loa loa TaxID=7209 RepID=A0A1I7VJX6_LOALO|nr:hypothetical protein LOAG_11875 [Loa loa]EFO16629.1 hypothetical protein LOAG_11875 [Loa loa]